MRLLKGTELLEGICPAVSTDHMKLARLLQSNAWRVWLQDEDTGLRQAASPRPGQTQLQLCKATACPWGLDHNKHVALQYHSLFKALHPQHFWLHS